MQAPPLPSKKYRTKLEASMIPIVERLAGQGLTLKNIAGALGVTEKTLKVWRDEGSEDECVDELKIGLAIALSKGRSGLTADMMDCMIAHARTDHKAASEVLKFIEAESYNPTKKVESKVELEASGPMDLSALSLEQMNAYRDVLRTLEQAKTKK